MSKPTRRINKEIRAELERLLASSRDQRLHWKDVVHAARNRSSPLHAYFDWNASRAMEHYLREQAEGLITSYTTVIQSSGGDHIRTRAFVSLTSDRQSGGGYRSVLHVLSDRDMRRQLFEDALSELAAFRERYKRLKELAEIFDKIDAITRRKKRQKATV